MSNRAEGVLGYLVVKCPFCHNFSIFEVRSRDKFKWRKKCPYCGRTFTIYTKRDRTKRIFYVTKYYDEAKEFLNKGEEVIQFLSKKYRYEQKIKNFIYSLTLDDV